MSLRKRPGKGSDQKATPDGLNEDAQEIIKDNLDVMYDIVMQIREDREFAKSIYADCPRLQHMLEKRPDLRPIFEDPRLVAINFEQVYRDAGGVLPEDEEEEEKKKKQTNYLAVIINSPCFKVLKFLLFFKKVIGCIFGGGMALLISMWKGLCCFDDPSDLAEDPEDLGDENPTNPNKEALYKAADHMEDPEVQKQMNNLLENDPDGLADAIEDDPELRELRDNNLLCAELMTDPETMRILTDPDNLRALGEAPDLIEADFNDPDWRPPDIENGGNSYGNAELDLPETDALQTDNGFQAANYASEDGMEFEFEDEDDQPDIEEEGSLELEEEDGAGGGGEEEAGILGEFELGDSEKNDRNGNANANKQQNKQRQQQQQREQEGQQQGGGFLSQVGAGITDMLAAQLVGIGISELTGQDDTLAGLEQAESAAEAGDGMASTASRVADIAAVSDALISEDMAENLEDGIDELENTHGATTESNTKATAAGVGVAAGVAAGVAVSRGTVKGQDEGEEVVEEKKKRFGIVENWASAISTASKEYIATALLGDDLGEMLVEKLEDRDNDDDDDDKSAKSDDETAEGDPIDCKEGSSGHNLQ